MAKKQKIYDTSDLTAPGYYIVNPHGTVHECTYGHAQNRLKQVGWRLATDGEIAEYHARNERIENRAGKLVSGPGQRFDDPIGEIYTSDPDEILAQRAEKAMDEAGEAQGKEEKEPEKASEPEKDEKDAEAPETAENGDLDGSEQSGNAVVVISEGKSE